MSGEKEAVLKREGERGMGRRGGRRRKKKVYTVGRVSAV